MNKAEERSKEIMQAALDYANNLDDIKPTDVFKRYLCIALGQAFIKGAEWADEHQAEKDNELSWKDIRDIYDLAYNLRFPHKKQKEFFEEVLKRFKAKKMLEE